MDVAIVRWPVEATERDRLQSEALPRLLLVEQGTPPPEPIDGDVLEDWVRLPADDLEIEHRVRGLRARLRVTSVEHPHIDADGILRTRDGWAALPPVEARLVGAMLRRPGAVVSRLALAKAGWPEGAPGRNALDVHVLRLRRRIEPLGLVIRTVRARGYLLDLGADPRQPAPTSAQEV